MAVTIDGTTGIVSPAIDLTTPLAVADGGTARSDNVMSMVRLNTANGYGSTNTKIRRFTNVVTNQGTDITYADSATLGASFTINTDGVYAVSCTDKAAGAMAIGLSLNTTEPAVSVLTISISSLLGIVSTAAAGYAGCVATTLFLQSGDVVRMHEDGVASSGSCTFTITRVR